MSHYVSGYNILLFFHRTDWHQSRDTHISRHIIYLPTTICVLFCRACQAPDKTCFLMPYTVWHERQRHFFFFLACWSCRNTARFVWLASEVKVTRLCERQRLICLRRLFKNLSGRVNENEFWALWRWSVQRMRCSESAGGSFVSYFSSCLELRVQGSHWGGTEGIYVLWIRPIVMLMWSDASDDPQSGIILYESAPRLGWIHTRRHNLRITQLHIKINVRELWAVSALIVCSLCK